MSDPTGMCIQSDVCEEIRRNPSNYNILEVLGCLQDEPCPCCGPDATEWIFREIKNHTNYASSTSDLKAGGITFSAMGLLNEYIETILYPISIADTPGDILGAIRLAIYGLAVDYGDIDYNQLVYASWGLSPDVPTWPNNPQFTCEKAISVCGRCQNPTDYGNFILGAAIHAAGEDRIIATSAGVIFNALTEKGGSLQDRIIRAYQDVDTKAVEVGYDFSAQGGVAVQYDRNNFCSKLAQIETQWFDTLNACESLIPCQSPDEPNLDWATNSFPHWNSYVSQTVYHSGGVTKDFSSPQAHFLALVDSLIEIVVD